MPAVPDEDEWPAKATPPDHISAAREAFRVLNGSREELPEA